ncbi:hypothetical protein JQ609_20315 [Bradyrhizobium sp. AUGA SZCCT0169]|uniref:hypothetical protein n=1 Tax=Bradyrhizobium sp. AUGA SZCCT0169 TaxID=2807663 RepID=UPI001BAC6A0D|nr:hypothetical protein [Bradyrhizobium sp. AUGA SZCCT0169]MBR1249261.1 hypothetical protein [Bradyrhizobium sp. AUGA SZCCT0169]
MEAANVSSVSGTNPRGRGGLAAFAFRRYVICAIGGRFWFDQQGEGSMTLMSRHPVEGIA